MVEASTTSMSTEASIASMAAGGRFHGSAGSFPGSCGSFHGSGKSFDGSGGAFRDFHGSFHRFRGNVHFQDRRSWKLPWKLLEKAFVEVPSGSFHGSFRGTGFACIGFRELPSVIPYFDNLQAVSRSFHGSHGSCDCFHCVRGSFHGGRFRGRN